MTIGVTGTKHDPVMLHGLINQKFVGNAVALLWSFFLFPLYYCVMSSRVTRQSKRIASLSATATPLSTASPVFTSGRQSIATETPITSEGSDDDVVLDDPAKSTQTKRVTRSVSARGSKKPGTGKRPANDDDAESLRAQKRRAVSTQVYVSIPYKMKPDKAKVCVRFMTLCN